jgi:hypothetical protein
MAKTFVSVCKNQILSNLKHGTNEPVIRVSHGLHGKPKRVHEFTQSGTVTIKYSPNKPAPWGARVWLEIEPPKRDV